MYAIYQLGLILRLFAKLPYRIAVNPCLIITV